jgi:hypothetical protein
MSDFPTSNPTARILFDVTMWRLPMPVETARVEGRRKVAYASFEELLADADRLGSGPLKALGNWSEGQIYRHLAKVYNGSIDGISITFPWPVRILTKVFRKKILAGAMPPGFKLPADGTKALVPEPTTAAEGLADLRAAVDRLKKEPHRVRHPLFGKMTREEWDKLHLAHASLHMSFLVPEG